VYLVPLPGAPAISVSVWIDTGFTGDLVVPNEVISRLALQQSGTTLAVLADGSEVAMRTYSSHILWFGEERPLEVIGNEGAYPLLGVGLLLDRSLQIDYRDMRVELN
jgi:clan AA aspartic protease